MSPKEVWASYQEEMFQVCGIPSRMLERPRLNSYWTFAAAMRCFWEPACRSGGARADEVILDEAKGYVEKEQSDE